MYSLVTSLRHERDRVRCLKQKIPLCSYSRIHLGLLFQRLRHEFPVSRLPGVAPIPRSDASPHHNDLTPGSHAPAKTTPCNPAPSPPQPRTVPDRRAPARKSVVEHGKSGYKERARSPFQTLTPGHGGSSKGGYHHAKAGFCRVHRADTCPAAGLRGQIAVDPVSAAT